MRIVAISQPFQLVPISVALHCCADFFLHICYAQVILIEFKSTIRLSLVQIVRATVFRFCCVFHLIYSVRPDQCRFFFRLHCGLCPSIDFTSAKCTRDPRFILIEFFNRFSAIEFSGENTIGNSVISMLKYFLLRQFHDFLRISKLKSGLYAFVLNSFPELIFSIFLI